MILGTAAYIAISSSQSLKTEKNKDICKKEAIFSKIEIIFQSHPEVLDKYLSLSHKDKQDFWKYLEKWR